MTHRKDLWAILYGQQASQMPASLQWGRAGFNVQEGYLGEGTKDELKMCPESCDQQRAITNGLQMKCDGSPQSGIVHFVASAGHVDRSNWIDAQRLVDFFWPGYHWLKAPILYLSTHEGGQGLIDLKSQVAAFQRLFRVILFNSVFYHSDFYSALLREAGGFVESSWPEQNMINPPKHDFPKLV